MISIKDFSDNPDKTRRIGLIVIGIGLLILLVTVHIVWWPWLTGKARSGYNQGETWNDLRLFTTMEASLNAIWYSQAKALVDLEKKHLTTGLTQQDLEVLRSMPGVLDAFYLDLPRHSIMQVEYLVPQDSLSTLLDQRTEKYAGGRNQFGRILIGGLTRFYRVHGRDKGYPVLARHVGTYYATEATQYIGLVLDEDWFIRQVPDRLDSLARNNETIALMSPFSSDTLEPGLDPYIAATRKHKQTLGVLYGSYDQKKKDTLWWYGDRTVKVKHYGGAPMAYRPEFHLSYHSKTQFVADQKEISSKIKTVNWLFLGIECNALLLIALLVYFFYESTRQSRRNQIALAHLAHAVKTPVARLKLAAETFTEGRVASPEEERLLIKAVARESDRLDRAVKNAALSLEKGRRTFELIEGDLAGVVTEIADSWKPAFDQAGIQLTVDAHETLKARFDAEMLPVMLDNLIDNALRHTRMKVAQTRPIPPLSPPSIEGGEIRSPLSHSSIEVGEIMPPAVTISLRSEVGS